MKTKIIIILLITAFNFNLLFAQKSDCPSLTMRIDGEKIDSYDNKLNINNNIIIKLEGSNSQFKIKVKLILIPAIGSNAEILVKGYASLFTQDPIIDLPINTIIGENKDIQKVILSIVEILDESNSQLSCFSYGQEYTFWIMR